jgi:hypothetical protein
MQEHVRDELMPVRVGGYEAERAGDLFVVERVREEVERNVDDDQSERGDRHALPVVIGTQRYRQSNHALPGV